MFQNFYKCEYGYGLCKALNTQCPHWQGIFCELDEHFVQDCHKCIYEANCNGNPIDCKRYKRDALDGGYY